MNEQGLPQAGQMAVSTKDQPVTEAQQGLIDELKQRFTIACSADGENHREALDDLRFLKGHQWPERQRRDREVDGRPCLTINKIPTYLQQVTNDQRQNRSVIKVSPTGLNSNAKTALLIQGAIRHMEYKSAAETAYDTAVNSAAGIGFGYFRLKTDYVDSESFDQEILVKRIRNPFTVYFDPASVEADGSDAQWVIISEKMTKDEFKAKYPNAECTLQGFQIRSPGDSEHQNWVWENMVRIAEYYKIEFTPGIIYKMPDGKIIWGDEETKPEGFIAQRPSVKRTVMWRLMTPYEILEETEIKCNWIPVFPVYGTEIDVDGKIYRAGLIRNAKDPAMMYNFWMTSATEEVSLRPKTPYMVAEGQIEGHEKQWRQVNNRSFPYLQYKPVTVDGQLAPPPQRQAMADVPVGVLAMAMHASDNIKATTGLFDSSLGAAGNATSGKQEIAQQKQGNVANFHYTDNFIRTLKHAGRCIVNMIPHYYDQPRLVRCMGEDGTITSEAVNQYDEAAQTIINDLSIGEYDITITSGPSYATMRAEAGDAMIQFGQSWPKLMDIAGDKVVKAMNWPGAEEIAERIARTIPPEIRDEPKEGEEQIPPAAKQKIAELEKQMAELKEIADKNKSDIEREHVKAKAAVEAAHLGAESRKDVAELTGLVKLLIANMPPPPELSTNVAQDLGGAGQEGAQQVSQVAAAPEPQGMPVNDDSQQVPE